MNEPNDNRDATPSPNAGGGAAEAAILESVERLDVCLIDPSYSLVEVRGLTGVSATSIRRWLSSYPPDVQEIKAKWTIEDDRWPNPLLVSFLELTEILVAGNWKAATGKSLAAILRYNAVFSSEWRTHFPFAHENMLNQSDALPETVVRTLDQMDYENGFVSRWCPFGKDGALALDPRRAGGQPAIKGRRLRVVDIRGYFAGGDSIDFLAEDFDIDRATVESALRFAFLTEA